MIISEILRDSARKLAKAGISSPELDARILLEEATGKSRSYIIANSESELSVAEINAFTKLMERRLKREPISQIMGRKEFWGREFEVSPDVLTPRPETELIIVAALKAFPKEKPLRILDLGTGSGCIILTLLMEFPDSTGIAVDISKTALAIARQNAYNHGIDRVEFVLSEWCENVAPQRFDLIVSNPPYISLLNKNSLDKELSYEPETALFSGDEGLDSYREIAEDLSDMEFGLAIFEIGQNQEDEIRRIFAYHGIDCVGELSDLAGITRTMMFRKKVT